MTVAAVPPAPSIALPPWGAAWIAAPVELTGRGVACLQALGRRSPAARELLLRFPPAAILGCLCGDPGCARRFAIVGRYVAPANSLLVALSPAAYRADDLTLIDAPGMLLLGCRAFLDRDLLAGLIDGPDA